jgi:hypothetical protein
MDILEPMKESTLTQAQSSVTDFVSRWESSGAAERANYQLFLSELCDFLGVPRPNPTVPDDTRNHYVFERNIHFSNVDGTTSMGRIDLYKRGSFVLEAKQGSNQAPAPLPFDAPVLRRGTAIRGTLGWDEAMLAARGQAEQYAKALPISEGWPPFLLVVDVGFSIELYADFSLTGKAYIPFPDSRNHRILLTTLQQTPLRDRLRAVWLDPLSLDPSRRAADVTKAVAARLAALARVLEEDFDAERVSGFLMRCIFTSFAENVKLLPKGWVNLLESLKEDVQNFPGMVSSLWQTMNEGGFSPILREHVLKFNGGLFESVEALPLEARQLDRLIEAAKSDWSDVEPAIFGTLLERALSPDERHRLGAHYTPRAYVERLVVPTIVEPLRYDWNSVQAAAVALRNAGKSDEAIDTVKNFHKQLCNTRVLDPACGSGNFLYVSLEHLKRLEGEVLETLHALGESQEALEHTGRTVDPHQLLGLEVNPRAAHITDLVLWIGYLQWHFRTRGDSQPPEPVIKRFHNIEHRDALLKSSETEPALDEEGQPITQWDGKTTRTQTTTGEEVPDEMARKPVLKYLNPQKAQWPKADFIIGNPPFIGPALMRASLGDGYVEAVRSTYDNVPDSADYVMYWWERAAELARAGKIRRFGFITTNSLPQVFNRRVVAAHVSASKDPLSIVYAVPDHPWLEAGHGAAAVRIAMTVGEKGEHEGLLCRVINEQPGSGDGMQVELSELRGKIFPDLKVGVDISAAKPLRANETLSSRGVSLHGAGFIVTAEEADDLGINRHPGLREHIREYRNGRDLTSKPRGVMVIDLFGMTSDKVRTRFPEVYQRILDRVKPERDENNRPGYSENWWIFGEPRANFRPALRGLHRYISTVETSKHRFFVFLDADILPDNKLVNMALEDAFYLGVLSSHIHLAWVAGNQSLLENRPVYVKTMCFDPFPFPACSEAQKESIRSHAEELDAHRKRQQDLFPNLKMTDMYNVIEKLRAGEPFVEREQEVYEEGLVAVLKEIHDRLDAAVADAYGWPANLTNDEILQRVVILNAERAREEQNGTIRWLRPEYQQPQAVAVQTGLGITGEQAPAAVRTSRLPWPPGLSEQVQLIKDSLRSNQMLAVDEVASRFIRARRTRVHEILETLTTLGQIRRVNDRYLV